jgi:spermidine/putrescine transport system permease protein
MNGPARSRVFLAPPAAPALLLLVAFFVIPGLTMLVVSFFTSSFMGIEWEPTFRNYVRLVSSDVAFPVLSRSLWVACVVTFFVLLLAYPVAYWIVTRRSQFRHLLLLLVLMPYWISYVVRTYAWYPLLGTNGVINTFLVKLGILSEPSQLFLFSDVSVYLGLIYVWFPFAAVPIYLALDRIDRSYLEASADLGASRLETFWRVVFPLSLSGTVGGGTLVFILTAGSYVTPKLLGGPSSIMFGEIVVDQFGGTFDWSFGATLSLVFTVAVGVVLLIVGRWVGLRQIFLGREG